MIFFFMKFFFFFISLLTYEIFSYFFIFKSDFFFFIILLLEIFFFIFIFICLLKFDIIIFLKFIIIYIIIFLFLIYYYKIEFFFFLFIYFYSSLIFFIRILFFLVVLLIFSFLISYFFKKKEKELFSNYFYNYTFFDLINDADKHILILKNLKNLEKKWLFFLILFILLYIFIYMYTYSIFIILIFSIIYFFEIINLKTVKKFSKKKIISETSSFKLFLKFIFLYIQEAFVFKSFYLFLKFLKNKRITGEKKEVLKIFYNKFFYFCLAIIFNFAPWKIIFCIDLSYEVYLITLDFLKNKNFLYFLYKLKTTFISLIYVKYNFSISYIDQFIIYKKFNKYYTNPPKFIPDLIIYPVIFEHQNGNKHIGITNSLNSQNFFKSFYFTTNPIIKKNNYLKLEDNSLKKLTFVIDNILQKKQPVLTGWNNLILKDLNLNKRNLILLNFKLEAKIFLEKSGIYIKENKKLIFFENTSFNLYVVNNKNYFSIEQIATSYLYEEFFNSLNKEELDIIKDNLNLLYFIDTSINNKKFISIFEKFETFCINSSNLTFFF